MNRRKQLKKFLKKSKRKIPSLISFMTAEDRAFLNREPGIFDGIIDQAAKDVQREVDAEFINRLERAVRGFDI